MLAMILFSAIGLHSSVQYVDSLLILCGDSKCMSFVQCAHMHNSNWQ